MGDEAVRVIVRCRPMNDREEKLTCETVVKIDTRIAQVQLCKPKSADRSVPPKMFTFDGSYFTKDTTKQIYDEICFPLVEGVLQGFNGTVFAYGQTGCGKSYTMMGVSDPPEQTGVIPRAFDHIFDHIAVAGDTKFLVHASYLEIYNEEVRDLLGKDVKKKLELKEHPERGVYVQGLSTHKVHNPKDLERVMSIGSKNRSVGATLMNVDSSRSHSIFTINLEMIGEGPDGEESLKSGKLNLVDLAGSERQSKTGSTGERLKEATKINLSLSALGNVISALVDGKSTHIPYRDSKLTRLLQSSLGGNTKTLMIACVSPADNNYDETLSTLRYANRAKNIKNKPRVNEDPKDALLREYQEEIKKLKMLLLGQTEVPGSLGGVGGQPGRDFDAELAAIREDYERQIAELKAQFGDEHSSKTQLAEELRKLQESYDRDLASAKEQRHAQAAGGMAPLTNGAMASGNDREILVEHERAVQRWETLQTEMIGGERTDDQQLKEKMAARQKVADDRLTALREANSGLDDDDDGILERIFNSLTEEVRAKTRALERMHDRLQSAEGDISDLQAEFQEERQDYLDTLRRQEQTILLQQQILDTMVPLIRRECNYHNLDKVLSECKFDEDSGKWILPKVSTASNSLSPVTSKSLVTSSSSASSTSHSPHHVKPKRHTLADNGRAVTEDHLSQRLQRAEEQNYFKQKRAQELLAECSMMKEMSNTPPTSHRQIKGGGVSLGPMQHSSISISHDPPLTHGVDNRFLPANDSLARPRKLESLIPLPGTSAAGTPLLPLPDKQTMVNKADKMIAAQKKRGPEGPRKPYL